MEATGNCTIAIDTTQEARKQSRSIIFTMYEGYVSCLVVAQPFVMPCARHVHLGLYIEVSLKYRTTCIWCFGCGFACTTGMGCAGFKLIIWYNYCFIIIDYYQIKSQEIKDSFIWF